MEWTDRQKQGARSVADSYEGTPHRNRIAIPGVGVDCIMLVIAIYRGARLIPEFDLPQYKPNLGFFSERNIVGTIIQLCGDFEEINPARQRLQFGDLLIFKVGHQSNHIGIVIDNKCVHSAAGRGFRRSLITRRFLEEIQTVLRMVKPGIRRDPAKIDCLTQEPSVRIEPGQWTRTTETKTDTTDTRTRT